MTTFVSSRRLSAYSILLFQHLFHSSTFTFHLLFVSCSASLLLNYRLHFLFHKFQLIVKDVAATMGLISLQVKHSLLKELINTQQASMAFCNMLAQAIKFIIIFVKGIIIIIVEEFIAIIVSEVMAIISTYILAASKELYSLLISHTSDFSYYCYY